MFSDAVTRRDLLAIVASSGFAATSGTLEPSAYKTPYKIGKLILSPSSDRKAFDAKTVDCPFVFENSGRFYMTYVGFDGTGYQTGLASSSDLVTWRREGCILRRNPDSVITRYNIAMNWIVRENSLHSTGKLKRVNGRFLGAYHAYPNAGLEEGPALIGLCWSDDLRNWSLSDPCLRPQDGDSWERGGLYKPCILEHAGTYYLFYNAKTEGKPWNEQTGVATSSDLKTWKRHPGNPILHNGGRGSWDEKFASDPCVLLDGKRWLLYYFGLDGAGKARDLLAIGHDPFTFEKIPEIVVDVGPPGSVDSTYAHKPSVIAYDGSLYHFYCAVSGSWPNEIRGISVARSKPW